MKELNETLSKLQEMVDSKLGKLKQYITGVIKIRSVENDVSLFDHMRWDVICL